MLSLVRYDLVVHMTSAANGAESHYTCDTNDVREESLQEVGHVAYTVPT